MTTKQRPRDKGAALRPAPAPVRKAILEAVSALDIDDLQRMGAWQVLSELSSNTLFDGIEANPDGIFETDKDTFEAIATVYVTLQYGGAKDGTSMADSFPARVTGKTRGPSKMVVDSVEVDTSSFYE